MPGENRKLDDKYRSGFEEGYRAAVLAMEKGYTVADMKKFVDADVVEWVHHRGRFDVKTPYKWAPRIWEVMDPES